MSDETPRVVNLAASAELDVFLSEFPSEGPAAAEPQALPAIGQDAFTSEALARREADREHEKGKDQTGRHDVGAGATGAKPATVTEFPVHATRPPTPPPSALVPSASAITLVDLLERQGGLEWRRAVAVIHQICVLLKQQPPHQPILLEPRNILITHDGQVRLLPALSSGDPLVIQLGRLLRTMLTGNDAPPELRLLLAQATFELPIFESVEDVDRALAHLERLEHDTPNAKAFVSPIVTPPVTDPAGPAFQEPTARSKRSILPPHVSGRRSTASKLPFRSSIYTYGFAAAAIALVAAGLGALMLMRPSLLWPGLSGAAVTTSTPVTVAPTASNAPATPAERSPIESSAASGRPPAGTPPSTAPVAVESSTRPPVVTIPAPALVPVPDVRSTRESVRTTDARRPASAAPESPAGPAASRATPPRNPAPTPAPAVSPRESAQRAASLIAQGQTEQAGIVFDALLLSNPLYEPDPSSLTPEALDAFRASQRTLLPNIAQKNVERARAALAAGDPERALALSREVATIIERHLPQASPQLREQVEDVIDAASLAKTEADEIVYTVSDKGVVAPRELSRQFPASTPIGVPPHRVGTLEMIIDKDGGVEFVKLHTPLNRYHERMIVSAAKAWRYRPATRNGKPVKYRLTVRINLPESGTDF